MSAVTGGEVWFEAGLAGHLAEALQPTETRGYLFQPVRSLHHLALVQALAHGPVTVTVVEGGKRSKVRATSMTAREITLEPRG
jgi:hypothetical protein